MHKCGSRNGTSTITILRYLILTSGEVKRSRKVDGIWRYTVVAKSREGRGMVAVFEFERHLMTLVTVHPR
jgi:hypothetical protein